jgi:fructokinase
VLFDTHARAEDNVPVVETNSGRTLCLGEALVDFVGERPGAGLPENDRFSPHFGGTVGNVAVVAAELGARIALAGGTGDDVWGRWLRDRLEQARVDLSLFSLVEGLDTPLAFVSVDSAGEPIYQVRGESTARILGPLTEMIDQAVEDATALFITTNTLVGPSERELTMRARERALELERPVVFDANLRLNRWTSRTDAAASANACVHGAMLVRANLAEAELLTGESDPERAAMALVKSGARLVVLTLGEDGAILRGALRAKAPGVPCRVLNTAGAGDVLTGTLLARLALSGFYPSSVAAALPEAVEAAAKACERWGALD